MERGAQVRTGARGADTTARPERTCAVTRATLAPDELIRFVRAPDGGIVPDLARRLPGRGVWVACSRQIVEVASKRNVFARAMRRTALVPPDLSDLVERLMVRRVMEALSLANKAGLVQTGFSKVEVAAAGRRCMALVHASDAADDGAAKLDRVFRAVRRDRGESKEAVVVAPLASSELSLAMGRSNVVHAALTQGGAGRHFLEEAGRLQRYRTGGDALASGPEAGAKTEQA